MTASGLDVGEGLRPGFSGLGFETSAFVRALASSTQIGVLGSCLQLDLSNFTAKETNKQLLGLGLPVVTMSLETDCNKKQQQDKSNHAT